ncbi:MAG: DUF4091 domain-containing protein [Clostridiales bacterium]|jgi:hypothetical protein|nr:DUF4091 domain-containing protein [Clostridiales bacterium]
MKDKNRFITVSSLEKVFPNDGPKSGLKEYGAFRNEAFHFQAAFFTKNLLRDCRLEIVSEIRDYVSARVVEPVPAYLSRKRGEDDGYILKKRGDCTLYPDLLRPMEPAGEFARQGLWTVFWITADGRERPLPPGRHEIHIALICESDTKAGECIFTLDVADAFLPAADLRYTAWIHYDCIAEAHGLEIFSDAYYPVLNAYLKSAVSHGMTMLYTPLFTPPLDTAAGGERMTAQLTDVTLSPDGAYRFGFDKLRRFIGNAKAAGVSQFEFSHIATQWDARACPKIVARTAEGEKRIFGWDTESTSEAYLGFLDAFFKALSVFVRENGLSDAVCFHISDEPSAEILPRFRVLKEKIAAHFANPRIIDALSDPRFLDEGIVTDPAAATDHFGAFAGKGLKWVYYCGWQRKNYLSNRFFNMPSQRNRILGFQLYQTGVSGFLHWGFNFYRTVLSRRPIDPYFVTDAGGGFESGDSFIVYPYGGGAAESLRHEVFFDGIQDYRALKLLESLTSRAYVLSLLKKEGIDGFTKYPRSADRHLRFRAKINGLIRERTRRAGGAEIASD